MRNYSDYDKIITIFTDKFGKIDVLCNGARKTKSKVLHLTQQFCFGEYIISKGKDMYILNSGALNNSFQTLLTDYEKLMLGTYFLEFIDKSTEIESKNIYILALLLKTLYILESGVVNLKLLKVVFDFKLISLLGYTPQVIKCVICGNININNGLFSNEHGGIICSNCTNKKNLDNNEIKFFRIIRNIKLEELVKLNYDEKIIRKIEYLLKDYINYYLSIKLNTQDFINI
ncbi:DNA repair protein RecO [Thermobrachium celere DSM 8682]|uniref:DNA repair protein RecO n=1 Tax=Thermobrachium celere DSM 8682 TaxID=941824 RepID=R7RS47_9CLOT|nr:DNA repair protein RecO [Thermobrachium celere DSM 8682]